MAAVSSSRRERWVKTEKADSRSISSPKNSIRIGSRPVVGNTSTSPPRTENVPRSSTVSARSYPAVASDSWTMRRSARNSAGPG